MIIKDGDSFMGTFATLSCNRYCNFTNYGTALQSWALHQAVKKMGHRPILADYCPDALLNVDPLNPFKDMWDRDDESRRMAELSMPSIRENHEKIIRFYTNHFEISKKKYTSVNLNCIRDNEHIDGFICGGDTIFCPDEFGFDNGFYANVDSMKGKAVSYAASFGDSIFDEVRYRMLDERIPNFKALGIRDEWMIPHLAEVANGPVKRVLDPTLLLEAHEYADIVAKQAEKAPYLLLYSRRYNPQMERFAEQLAEKKDLKIVEISLRATNYEKGHKMAYNAGVEEFLSLVKNADYVITNSYHGMIFSIQFQKLFSVFRREKSVNKVEELLERLGLGDRLMVTGLEESQDIDYDRVHEIIKGEREESLRFLDMALGLI